MTPGADNVFSTEIAENVPPFVLERVAPGQMAPLVAVMAAVALSFLVARPLVWGRVLATLAFAGLALMANRNVLLFYWVAHPAGGDERRAGGGRRPGARLRRSRRRDGAAGGRSPWPWRWWRRAWAWRCGPRRRWTSRRRSVCPRRQRRRIAADSPLRARVGCSPPTTTAAT